LFVSFFPLLVAGPIERANHLLPQIKNPRVFSYEKSVDGLRQILWGLFKKVVIADNCATHANMIFENSSEYSGFTLFIGALFFSFQIYGDFSGYSDIALGTARLLGIELLRNFSFPYFSRDIAEFWRRWHISLSTWFRDYIYIPLGGSKVSVSVKIRNTFIIFSISGLWHGANWTFIAWGLLNALYFMPLLLRDKNRDNIETVATGRQLPSLMELFDMLSTFVITVFAWIFFRSDTITGAIQFICKMFLGALNKSSYIQSWNYLYWEVGLFLPIAIIMFFIVEWIGRFDEHALETFGLNQNRVLRFLFYYTLVLIICLWGGSEQEFIYFQF
jgi:alginate O-acetyltransferase complex protein AlgI